MKLKNVSGKIVSVGETTVLPGSTVEITGKAFENNGALNFLVRRKYLETVSAKAPGRGK